MRQPARQSRKHYVGGSMHWSSQEAFGERMANLVDTLGIPLQDCQTFANGFIDFYECVSEYPHTVPAPDKQIEYKIYLAQEYFEADRELAIRVCAAAGRAAVERERAIRSQRKFRPLLHHIYDEIYRDDERV